MSRSFTQEEMAELLKRAAEYLKWATEKYPDWEKTIERTDIDRAREDGEKSLSGYTKESNDQQKDSG